MAYRSTSNLEPYHGDSLLPPNSFYSTDTSYDSTIGGGGGIRRAMSVMSSSSYQYTADDNESIRSAPPPPDTGLHLSKQDLASSIESYESLVKAAQVYQDQMKQLSGAAAGFGYALERVARGRGASDAGQSLQAAAGLQFLISNHQQILSDMFSKALEIPLNENLNHHRKTVEQSQGNYASALKLMSKKIRDTEARNMKNGRKGQRDIRQFRKALQDLTRQVDELDRIKTDYHRHMAEVERRNHYFILSKVATVVRAQVDIYERISNKGLADPMLEQMMHQNPDPFCAYSSTADESTEIFTVLPPVSLIDYPPQTPITAFDADDYGLFSSGAATPIPQEDEDSWSQHQHQQSQLQQEEEKQSQSQLVQSPSSYHHHHHHRHQHETTDEQEKQTEKQQKQQQRKSDEFLGDNRKKSKEEPKIAVVAKTTLHEDDDRSSAVSSGDESTQTQQVRKETSVGGGHQQQHHPYHSYHHDHHHSPTAPSLPPPPLPHSLSHNSSNPSLEET